MLFRYAAASFLSLLTPVQGVVRGTIQYSWPLNAYRLWYSSAGYQEIYDFNNLWGEGANPALAFKGQWMYRQGASCPCETSAINHVMPQLFAPAPSNVTANYVSAGSTLTINGTSCARYNKRPERVTDVTSLWWSAFPPLLSFPIPLAHPPRRCHQPRVPRPVR